MLHTSKHRFCGIACSLFCTTWLQTSGNLRIIVENSSLHKFFNCCLLLNPLTAEFHVAAFRAGSRPVQQMPMHLSEFDGDAYLTVCIGQILTFLLLLSLVLLLARKRLITYHYQLEPKVTHKHTSYRGIDLTLTGHCCWHLTPKHTIPSDPPLPKRGRSG